MSAPNSILCELVHIGRENHDDVMPCLPLYATIATAFVVFSFRIAFLAGSVSY